MKKRPRVLIADDEPAMRELLKGLLAEDYDVVRTAQDGQTLITAALQLRPDIIVSDIEMRGMDGIQAARQLNALIPEANVLMLSGHADLEHVAAAFSAGAAGFLIKGNSPDFLDTLLRTLDGLSGKPEPAVTRLAADRR